jgi:hypothetical protein
LDSNDGAGYQLQGSTTLNGGALYQGDDPESPSWDRPWTVGRGEFGGGPADFFDGIIDEVRITNAPLSPSQFLFAPAMPEVDGDYNDNGIVDAADYVVWRDFLGQNVAIPNDATPGSVMQEDYDVWRRNYGAGAIGSATAVPEPAALTVCLLAIAGWMVVARTEKRSSRSRSRALQ